jgi:hypothetical protein
MAKTAQVVAHVEPAIRQALEELARTDGRTLSTYAERLLLAHLAKKKKLPAKARVAKVRP